MSHALQHFHHTEHDLQHYRKLKLHRLVNVFHRNVALSIHESYKPTSTPPRTQPNVAPSLANSVSGPSRPELCADDGKFGIFAPLPLSPKLDSRPWSGCSPSYNLNFKSSWSRTQASFTTMVLMFQAINSPDSAKGGQLPDAYLPCGSSLVKERAGREKIFDIIKSFVD